MFMRQLRRGGGEIISYVFSVKLYSNPEVDAPFALENLDIFDTSPLHLAVTRPRCVSLRLVDEFHDFPCEGEL